jgi:pimeloyl-ACP methyl ester carboxylesterase
MDFAAFGRIGMRDLVFLHGGNHGSWCWAPVLAELNKSPNEFGRVFALDMPGCGTKRGREVNQETLQTVVSGLNDELRSANVSGAVLIGHSIAGALLPMMVIEDPKLFAHVIYLTTSLPEEGQSIMEMMGTKLHGEDPEHVGWPANPATTPPAELALKMFDADLSAEQVAWLLSEVAQDVTPPAVAIEPVTRKGYAGLAPATFILTLRDPILPPAWQRRFAERANCKTIVEIDTPHEPFISHPALLAETLRPIIAASQ